MVVGALAGFGGVAWMATHPADVPVSSSKGGSVLLDDRASPTPTPASSLSVLSPAAVAAAGGETSALTGNAMASNQSAGPSPAPNSPNALDPSQFGQYDSYRDKPTAMFGDVIVGTGAAVTRGSAVTVNYRGWLTNGTLFDESYSTKNGFTFTEGAGKVISGWEEGVFGMKIGGRRLVIVPPALGYGSSVHGPIPGNSVLVFEIELVDVK